MQEANYSKDTSGDQIDSSPCVKLPKFGGITLWFGVFFIVFVVGLSSAWNAYVTFDNIVEHEFNVLAIQARQREASISGALRSVDLMIGGIIDDLHQKPSMSDKEQIQLLNSYLKLLPEIRSLLIADANGRIRVHTMEAAIGFDASNREYFTSHRNAPEKDSFHISLPFKTAATGIMATTLSRVIRDGHGKFAGTIAATLESTFFYRLLKPSLSEPENQVLLINRNGDILNSAPMIKLIGENLRGGIAYTEHIKSEEKTTRHLNVTKLESIKRLSVFHDVPESPLIVVVSRNYSTIVDEFKDVVYSHVVGFFLLTITVFFVSRVAVRRQQNLYKAQQQIAEREAYLRTIIESEPECVKQLAQDGTLMQMNSAGLNMIEADSLDQVKGIDIQKLVTPKYREAFTSLTQKVFSGESGSLEFEIIGLKGGHRWLETHATPLRSSESDIVALLAITRDITERKEAEDALEEKNRQLQIALDEVKTLRGIVPICAKCKKIRDDKGFWNQVEKYVSDHTEATFTHGVCPDCVKDLYPDYYRRKLAQEEQ